MMIQVPVFRHNTSLPLDHNGDCNLLGATPDLTLYVEETYGEGDWFAQHALRLEGTRLASVDEADGTNPGATPLVLPGNLVKPQRAHHTRSLNFSGPRYRGLQETERIRDMVAPLTVQDKIALVKQLYLALPPPMLLGLVESTVLAEAELIHQQVFVVCRRLRLGYALMQPQMDDDRQPYDYDSLVIYAAHLYDITQTDEPEFGLAMALTGIGGIDLYQPMDCLIVADHLFIADGGGMERLNTIHIWKIDRATG
jgi:hypothetical protein